MGQLKALYNFLPSLTDLFIPTPFSASPGRILARQQFRANTKSLTFPPLSIARYSFIQLSQQGRQWRERKCPIFEMVAKGDSNQGSLDCESGVLPLSYRAPCHIHNSLFQIDRPSIIITACLQEVSLRSLDLGHTLSPKVASGNINTASKMSVLQSKYVWQCVNSCVTHLLLFKM